MFWKTTLRMHQMRTAGSHSKLYLWEISIHFCCLIVHFHNVNLPTNHQQLSWFFSLINCIQLDLVSSWQSIKVFIFLLKPSHWASLCLELPALTAYKDSDNIMLNGWVLKEVQLTQHCTWSLKDSLCINIIILFSRHVTENLVSATKGTGNFN